MAVTSTMLPLGTKAPDFSLRDLDGNDVSLGDFGDAVALVVAFLCNHCPYVRHVESALGRLADEYRQRGVALVGICSNDNIAYPDDGPDGLREQTRRAGFGFPYLIDEDQQVARAYQAACTPDFYLFDAARALVYRGQMDGSRPGGDQAVDGRDLRAALEDVLAGRPVSEDQYPSIGCSIKWKPS